ncbi:MAG: hypothetical protein COW88_02320 [Candidatus Lloydbacteria bacterium CG22_combo_CG10-13_8_21_14_all_47_15]|uniref:Uncharacterized protein n=1 Tax=Candidatus Lloydbacteria bacterium CG22_combo_CG10-13_8_21_14_all_47_15 TaxID=1974635 RepID=A0A2H0CUD6_9BACT|nr:MAG: hypothetical protein COW88_02320 [Candidatus Lloydbacteria bacterium CG22_combo_CG10-13_8_21_14_all_47_15]
MVLRFIQTFALGLFGFVVATIGFLIGTGSNLSQIFSNNAHQKLSSIVYNSQKNTVAQACVSQKGKEDEVFFLSCGGIF